MERVLDEISFQAPDLFKSPRSEATQEGVIAEVARVGSADQRGAEDFVPVAGDRARASRRDTETVVVVDPEYVRQQVASIVKDQDPEPLYFVTQAPLECTQSLFGLRGEDPRKFGRAAQLCGCNLCEHQAVVPIPASLLQSLKARGQAVCGNGRAGGG